ncbi:hypothetical protein PC129_g21647 [Phytophthora cactorum]|uniref:Uncharacterized protein n=1 Tax=Phytophthora cactorum TaxID=29920 RepID=A0A329RF89_9STRA|nr:hypothetical protein Pcac1_g26240 [Phytophthora cactorum]KAG2796109.1 hypothetical protein PC111_g21870 [Phytophthora cactorum]KAG2796357.1 hypothetical protein PC112_g22239 [Phytophthora cactorum]KAG2823821.1 hypothetical protein PC113_g22131 [Phytophthora cactorum]KAG2875507.1 hypothetical protein PC114_g24676 [Phytophthora cactorum]
MPKLNALLPLTLEDDYGRDSRALLDDAGCSDSMILAFAALYRPPVERPVVPNIRFCLTAATDVDAELDFRFDVVGFLLLTFLLALPEWVITKYRDCVHKTEARCIILHPSATPKCLVDMRKTFGRSEGALSRIVLHMDMKNQSTFTIMCSGVVVLCALMRLAGKEPP